MLQCSYLLCRPSWATVGALNGMVVQTEMYSGEKTGRDLTAKIFNVVYHVSGNI